jgi:LysR family nitrogen assimilation transcriptional regulator
MDYRQIRYFVHVADLRNVTRAASVLRISQPALSRQMHLLEDELGTKLFHRHGHGVVLTANGALFLDHCTRLLADFEDVRKTFDRTPGNSEITGVVGVGMPVPMIGIFADPFVSRFKKAHPGISLRIAEGFSALLHEWLLSGSMDLAMLYGVRPSKVLVQERLLVEDLVLIAPSNAPFAQVGRSIYLREVGDVPLILPNRPHGIRDIVDKAIVKPGAVIEVDALTLMIELVRAGKGATLMPRLSFSHVTDNSIVAMPLADAGMNWDVSLFGVASTQRGRADNSSRHPS